MATLADMLNAPSEIQFKGKTYLLRRPDLLEEGTFERWLAQRALDEIERTTYENPSQKAEDRKNHFLDVVAGVYEAGGLVYTRSMMSQTGAAKIISIICKDQGMTLAMAREMVRENLKGCVALIASKVYSDPKVVEAILNAIGLPSDYLSRNSSIRPSEVPNPSPPSADAAGNNSSPSTASNDRKADQVPPG